MLINNGNNGNSGIHTGNEYVTLNKLATRFDSTSRYYTCFTGMMHGHPVVSMELPINTFHQMTIVPNTEELGLAQRQLDVPHAKKLAMFFLKGAVDCLAKEIEENPEDENADCLEYIQSMSKMLGTQPFYPLQPFTGSLPSAGRKGCNLEVKEVADGILSIKLGCRDLIRILDGFHRKYGIAFLLEALDYVIEKHKFPKKASLLPFGEMDTPNIKAFQAIKLFFLTKTTVSIRIYLGLFLAEDRQVFHDINRLGKMVDDGLAFAFDSSNPVVIYVKDALVKKTINLTVTEKDQKKNDAADDVISMRDLVNVCTIFFTGKTSNKGTATKVVSDKEDIADRMWRSIQQIPSFGTVDGKKYTVAQQTTVLKAIARLAFDLGFGKYKNAEHLETLLNDLSTKVNFSHTNKLWQYYTLPTEEKVKFVGIENYIPEAIRNPMGIFSNSFGMKFAATSNDIFPIIGDMIRYQLGLPPRKKSKRKAK